MSKALATIACLALALPLMGGGPAQAADEDTSASVYLVFDPETGEFVTVDDPARTQQHIADQESIMAGVAQGDSASAAAGGATAAAGNAQSRLPMTLVIAAAVAAALLGGFFWLRRDRQSAS